MKNSFVTDAFIMGFGSGIAIPMYINANILHQLKPTLNPLWTSTGGIEWNTIVIFVGVISTLIYFFFSVEHKGVIPRELRSGIKSWIYGCDECLDICPFTSKSKETDWDELGEAKGVVLKNGDELRAKTVISCCDPRLTFSGLGVYRPALFLDSEPERFPLAQVLRRAVERGQVTGERYSGDWSDIGTPERLRSLAARLSISEHKIVNTENAPRTNPASIRFHENA